MSFLSKFYSHIFIPLKVISVLQKKRNRRNAKEVNKKKSKVMTQFLEAYVSLPVSSKNIHILLFQKQIPGTDFVIIRLQAIPKVTVT